MKPIKIYKLSINDDLWLCKLLKKEDYEKLHGTDSLGMTITSKKELHFLAESISKGIIAHEVMHLFWFYL